MRKCTSIVLLALAILSCKTNASGSYKKFGYNDFNSFVFQVSSFDSSSGESRVDTLGLFCSNLVIPNQDSQTIMQWQFLLKDGSGYRIIDSMYDNSTTGIKVSDSVLYIHPPRFNYLKELQFSPHPLFKNLNKVGWEWSWDLAVGSNWAIDSLYPIKDVDTFHFKYKIQDKVDVETALGVQTCTPIVATAISHYGQSKASYFFSETYGLLKFVIDTRERKSIEFKLVSFLKGGEKMKFNSYFFSLYKKSAEAKMFLYK